MTKRCCANCIYSSCSLHMKLGGFLSGFGVRPLCANHPDTPGQLRHVLPGGLCRNYRPKPAAATQPEGPVRRIPLSNGEYALVDAADFERLNRHQWRLMGSGYVCRSEKGKLIYMHREVMGAAKGELVDHKDRNRRNNYRSNLHICTPSENGYNHAKRAGSVSSYRGVFRRPSDGRLYGRAYFEREYVWLGFFDNEVDAARAYDRRVVELGITCAYLNFPDEWPPERRGAGVRRGAAAAGRPEGEGREEKGRKGQREKGDGTSKESKGKK